MIVRPGMQLALAGVVIGLALAFGLARVIATLLYGVTPRDPLVFTVVPLALTAVALVGVLLPARRAVRVDPIIALRTESRMPRAPPARMPRVPPALKPRAPPAR